MPELPEVETIAEDLRNQHLVGCQVSHIKIFWPGVIGLATKKFIKTILGQKITEISRRGKFLILKFSNDYYVFIHFRMTGRFILSSPPEKYGVHEHIVLTLNENRELRFHDTRKFGRWYLTSEPDEILKKLGPEPLEKTFTLKKFSDALKRSSRMLKPLLLDQKFIAGLGNIYVDEALWEAKLHPEKPANAISEKQIEDLYQAIPKVLQKGLETQGTTLGTGKTNFYRLDGAQGKHQNVMMVFRRTGKPCPRCGHLIVRIKVAQRSTHLCPNCQMKQ